jgi:multicomponent Na+:H+ antiporter subunit F
MMALKAFSLYVALPLLALAILLAFVRLVRGPSLPDRVVALDLLATLGIGIVVVYAINQDQPAFLDVAVILALVAFLGTVAFAFYIEKRSGS